MIEIRNKTNIETKIENVIFFIILWCLFLSIIPLIWILEFLNSNVPTDLITYLINIAKQIWFDQYDFILFKISFYQIFFLMLVLFSLLFISDFIGIIIHYKKRFSHGETI